MHEVMKPSYLAPGGVRECSTLRLEGDLQKQSQYGLNEVVCMHGRPLSGLKMENCPVARLQLAEARAAFTAKVAMLIFDLDAGEVDTFVGSRCRMPLLSNSISTTLDFHITRTSELSNVSRGNSQ